MTTPRTSMRTTRTMFGRSRWQVLPIALLCVGLLGVLASTPVAQATPSAPAAGAAWTLTFKPGPLRLYVDPIDGEKYWYFTYRVTNSTGEDRMFAPRAELFTDKGEIIRSGRGVPTEVTRRLRGLLQNKLLEDENQIIGDLRQGKEHAKDGLLIWSATDLGSNDLTIFLTGLSNDTEQVAHPVTGEKVVLRKTLRLDYRVAGNADERGSDSVESVPPSNTDRSIQMHARIPNALWIWR